MRELVERTIDVDAKGRGRAVQVNMRESPLAWLAARGLLGPDQVAAGERLRLDYEHAALPASVTMRWEARVDGGGGGLDPTAAQLAAKRRFHHAVDAVGPGLGDVLWRVVCAGEPLPAAETALGWPKRAGRVVLGLALDRLARHYGSGQPSRPGAQE